MRAQINFVIDIHLNEYFRATVYLNGERIGFQHKSERAARKWVGEVLFGSWMPVPPAPRPYHWLVEVDVDIRRSSKSYYFCCLNGVKYGRAFQNAKLARAEFERLFGFRYDGEYIEHSAEDE